MLGCPVPLEVNVCPVVESLVGKLAEVTVEYVGAMLAVEEVTEVMVVSVDADVTAVTDGDSVGIDVGVFVSVVGNVSLVCDPVTIVVVV